MRVLNTYRNLRSKPYWGNHFWSKGYCVNTVGMDEEIIRKYENSKKRKSAKRNKNRKSYFNSQREGQHPSLAPLGPRQSIPFKE